jgi:hypothetical protein
MKKINFKVIAIAFLASISLVFTGCQPQGPMEDAGETVDETVDDTGDELEDATN